MLFHISTERDSPIILASISFDTWYYFLWLSCYSSQKHPHLSIRHLFYSAKTVAFLPFSPISVQPIQTLKSWSLLWKSLLTSSLGSIHYVPNTFAEPKVTRHKLPCKVLWYIKCLRKHRIEDSIIRVIH